MLIFDQYLNRSHTITKTYHFYRNIFSSILLSNWEKTGQFSLSRYQSITQSEELFAELQVILSEFYKFKDQHQLEPMLFTIRKIRKLIAGNENDYSEIFEILKNINFENSLLELFGSTSREIQIESLRIVCDFYMCIPDGIILMHLNNIANMFLQILRDPAITEQKHFKYLCYSMSQYLKYYPDFISPLLENGVINIILHPRDSPILEIADLVKSICQTHHQAIQEAIPDMVVFLEQYVRAFPRLVFQTLYHIICTFPESKNLIINSSLIDVFYHLIEDGASSMMVIKSLIRFYYIICYNDPDLTVSLSSVALFQAISHWIEVFPHDACTYIIKYLSEIIIGVDLYEVIIQTPLLSQLLAISKSYDSHFNLSLQSCIFLSQLILNRNSDCIVFLFNEGFAFGLEFMLESDDEHANEISLLTLISLNQFLESSDNPEIRNSVLSISTIPDLVSSFQDADMNSNLHYYSSLLLNSFLFS